MSERPLETPSACINRRSFAEVNSISDDSTLGRSAFIMLSTSFLCCKHSVHVRVAAMLRLLFCVSSTTSTGNHNADVILQPLILVH